MSDPTSSKTQTLQMVLDRADPNELADAMRQMAMGTMLSPLKVTFASLSSAAAQNITSAAALAAATVVGAIGNQLPALAALPPILAVRSLRVTAGTAHQNPCAVTDAGGTATDPSSGISVVTMSDDGTTLTFGAAVTGFVLEYIPRPAQDPSTAFLLS